MKSLFAALLFAVHAVSAGAGEPPSAAPLFALSLHDLDQVPVALASFKGKPLIVNFWARWCGPCRKEIPDLADVHARFSARGLVVIGIAVEDSDKREQLREFGRAYDMTYTSLIGGSGKSIELMRSLGNSKSGLPFTVLIDKDGHIRSSKLGAMSRSEMEAAVTPIL
ncbi:TlpA disulfide reductase family protein [Accumulibacter sp.]|uniref:TlpA family protein disulfide reductase n=1 Tax=Accumulibacter sp. TaxID=2053492 RepID=UPI0028C44339|nr:TlpA disulfide reductase family protein [Accumulibacter sp.]